MNDAEHEQFAKELQRLRPAPLPEGLLARLSAMPAPVPERKHASRAAFRGASASKLFRRRWLAPLAAAALVLIAVVWRTHSPIERRNQPHVSLPPAPALTADEVEIDRQLVFAFDAISTLPSGEPVRWRCSEWIDHVRLRDSVRGVEIERQMPRFEVAPVRFETY